MTGHSGKLVRNTVLYLPAQFFPPVIQFATTVVWTYLLDPATFGIVAFVIAIQEIAAYMSVTWWSLFILRFRTRYVELGDERLRSMDNRMVAYAALIQIVLTAPALWLVGVSCELPIFIATAAYFISRMLFVHYGEWVRTEHLIGAYTTSQLVGSFASAGLSILAMLALGSSPAVALSAQALGQFAALALLFGQTGLQLGIGAFDKSIFADAKHYGAPLLISGFFGWVAGNSIRVIIQQSEGVVALGLFSVGWGLGQRIAAVLSMLFTAAAYPLAVKHLEGGDRKGALAQVSLNGVFLLAILTPAAAGAALLSAPLVNLMIAEPFRATTIIILPISLLAAALRGLRLHTADQTMLLLEHTRASMRFTIVESVVNAVFCFVGLHFYGVVGAALGVLVATCVICAGAFAYSFIRLGLPAPSAWTVLRIFVAVGVMSEAISLVPPPSGVGGLVAAVLAGASIYAIVIIMTFPECRSMVERQLKRV